MNSQFGVKMDIYKMILQENIYIYNKYYIL